MSRHDLVLECDIRILRKDLHAACVAFSSDETNACGESLVRALTSIFWETHIDEAGDLVFDAFRLCGALRQYHLEPLYPFIVPGSYMIVGMDSDDDESPRPLWRFTYDEMKVHSKRIGRFDSREFRHPATAIQTALCESLLYYWDPHERDSDVLLNLTRCESPKVRKDAAIALLQIANERFETFAEEYYAASPDTDFALDLRRVERSWQRRIVEWLNSDNKNLKQAALSYFVYLSPTWDSSLVSAVRKLMDPVNASDLHESDRYYLQRWLSWVDVTEAASKERRKEHP